MKYAKITSFYKPAIERYYSIFADITKESYTDQYRHFMDQCYSWGDVYERELTRIGIDAIVLPTNVVPLIKRWAFEHQITGTLQDILISQLREFDPDIIHINDTSFFTLDYIGKLKTEFPKLKLLIGWCCSPYNTYTLQIYRQCDFVICCCNQLSNELQEKNIRTHVVMHGFDHLIWEKSDSPFSKEIDVLFTGSIMPGKGFHQKRNELINAIVRSGIKVNIYGNITANNLLIVRIKQIVYLLYLLIKKIDRFNFLRFLKIKEKAFPQHLRISTRIRKNVQPPMFGIEMFELLKRSKICLNIHGDIATDDAANMRLFEATGMGCCLVTDWKKNMCTLFDDGKEVVTYQNIEDCVDKLKWLLNHPDKIKDIAEAGQKRCLKDHTISMRAQRIYDIIKMELAIGT